MAKSLFLFVFIVLCSCVIAIPQNSISNNTTGGNEFATSFTRQLQLIDSIRQFIVTDIELNIGDEFYTTWEKEENDSMYVFLYVSKKDSVRIPAELKQGLWFFESEDSARIKSNELNAAGHETLVYKTAGLSNTLLNRKLLSYPDEAIAFIVFHEAVHRHVGNNSIPYVFNESLADALANRACELFAVKTKMLSLKAVRNQKMIIETIYALLNKQRAEVEGLSADSKKDLFHNCHTQLQILLQKANPFLKDRMDYEVNLAYFLRVEAYALYYFDMKQLLEHKFSLRQIMESLIRGVSPKQMLYSKTEPEKD